MPFNPFSNDSENTSFEQGNPINQTAKNAAKAASTQATQQQQALSKAIVDQLYGVSTDANNKQAEDAAKKTQQAPGMQTISKQMNLNPDDQNQLEEARKKLHELQRMHKNYYEENLGEAAQKKRAQAEEQEKQLKLQEEAEDERRKAEEKAAQEENLAAGPQGKTGSRNRMSPPVAVTQAKTKTEINRGTTG
jgi:hypothetical protein